MTLNRKRASESQQSVHAFAVVEIAGSLFSARSLSRSPSPTRAARDAPFILIPRGYPCKKLIWRFIFPARNAQSSFMSAQAKHTHTPTDALAPFFTAFKRDVISNMLPPPSSFVFLSRRKSASTLFLLFAFFPCCFDFGLQGTQFISREDFISNSTVLTMV
jgi:hypothetical protein